MRVSLTRGVRMRPAGGATRGITLIEMMVVVAILTLLAGIVFPAVSSGIDGIRLTAAADDVASFLSGALNRAESRQVAVVISVSSAELTLESAEPGFSRRLELPEGIRVEAVHPIAQLGEPLPRHFLVLPGGVVPGIRVELGNQRGGRKLVSIDPITQVPEVRQGVKK